MFRGTPTRNTVFTVDLACTGGGKSDLAALFRLVFNDGNHVNTVIINDRFNGTYGKAAAMNDFPFEINVPFTMVWVLHTPLLQITVTTAEGSSRKDYFKTKLSSCYNRIELWGTLTISLLHMT
ncbi:uncharacterized protein LOC131927457 [Physella acuta]|uniref:uncharacterized protein LOC131927457 n=1 Tax=Physella acuta TaxID=109671 RepID=UPI0027DDB670|nr:uncharacterized protein LOC131927457 [Physella acuta]